MVFSNKLVTKPNVGKSIRIMNIALSEALGDKDNYDLFIGFYKLISSEFC